MKNKKTFYITTPIYYPSGNLHIGHLYSTIIAWTLKNYKKKLGYDVKFLTGSDEHGQKIEKKAKENNMQCQDYVNMQTNKFINLWKKFEIDYDFFSRTTNDNHKKSVLSIFEKMEKNKFIYKGIYKGLYSIEDEEFITEAQAIKINNEYYHPTSNHKLLVVEEESYFFKMSEFYQWLIDYIKDNPDFVIPKKILNELKTNFLNKTIEDLSITRVSFEWGIKLNNDPKHVIYVWLDALFNYVTALGYDASKNENEMSKDFIKYWKNGSEIIHVVGKEITRFHCIYWPIFLKSIDLRLPSKILAHGWIVTPEGKMSKSKGNVVNPLDLLNDFDQEIIKYYFISKININNDGIFSDNLLLSTYNADLVNNIGNLISRTIAMIKKNFTNSLKFKITNNEHDIYILDNIKNSFIKYKIHFDNFEIHKAFEVIIELGKNLNKYIDLTMPWTLKDNLDRLEQILNILLNGIFSIASMLEVVMPNYSNKIKNILNINSLDFDLIDKFDKFNDINIGENIILFPRK